MPRETFGVMPDGTVVSCWTLQNSTGMRVRLIDYGAAIAAIELPDGHGGLVDVALGYDTLDAYRTSRGCLGAVVGRFANRIACGRFTLDGREYQLPLRGGPHHLHGGPEGFDRQCWKGSWEELARAVRFARRSPAGEAGYPATCDVSVTYSLSDHNELSVVYTAVADEATPVNLSQHAYFNLAGHDSGDILAHEVAIAADYFTPVDETRIPTGEQRAVDATPFDLRSPVPVGSRVDADDEQLRIGGGFDHNFVLRQRGAEPTLAALVRDPVSGRTLEVRTTEPGVQFYSGNSLDGSQVGKGVHPYRARAGLCLETQHFPDSPNQPSFPSTILRPGAEFRSETVFAFGFDGHRIHRT